ncbi:hypothetical protein IFM89_012560 [Coptis chinensis]|uniref:B-like cyclin n=1 Tax=Coptis chinensis TaxID=261450 RepID=A0A835H3U9_9MAGN|nr:hypothetical protein IFM89_012560 [Coptis chinensis]
MLVAELVEWNVQGDIQGGKLSCSSTSIVLKMLFLLVMPFILDQEQEQFICREKEREKWRREKKVANSSSEEGGGSRLQILISSVISTFGGVFGPKQFQEQEDEEMGSRPGVPNQPRGGAVVVGGVKHKAGAAEGNNRRALIDVTNRGVDGRGIDVKPITRPVTRSYCAQILSKPQETVTENNNKKQIAVVVDGPIGGKEVAAVRKAALKNVTVRPKPEKVIEISPDTEEEKSEIRRQSREASSKKKKVHTLTSVLTARSKAACGITTKPKDAIIDIDAADADNHLAAVDYVEDIYKYYKLAENSSRVHDYMYTQHEINEKMRAILVDWLIEVHNKFELMPETLYLTVHIVDRYLSMRSVSRKILQLIGMSAMLIASKYEEIWAPEVNDFVCIADNAYSRAQILAMEKLILGKLEWNLTVPTPYVFLVRYIKAAASDQEMESMIFFLAELALTQYELIRYCSSMVAASAVYVARCTLNKSPFWDETLKHHTGFSESQLLDCAKMLAHFHSVASEDKLQAIRKKYTHPLRGAVALLPPAKHLLN